MSRAFLFSLSLGCALTAAPALAQQPAVSTPIVSDPVLTPLDCPTLVGVVTDGSQPLTGATVVVQGVQDAFSTNSQGQYIITLRKPVPANAHLQISAVGYETQKLMLTSCQPPAVVLRILPGTRFKRDGRIKKTTSTGKIR